jgi:nitrogen regulatory protein P-II 1
MKHIKAVIRPDKLSDVREALNRAGCYGGAMVSEIMGQGNQKGITQSWRGEKYQVDYFQRLCWT